MALSCFRVMKSRRDLLLAVCMDILRHSTRAWRCVNRIEFQPDCLKSGQTGLAATIGLLLAAIKGMSI